MCGSCFFRYDLYQLFNPMIRMATVDTHAANSSLAAEARSPVKHRQQRAALSNLPIIDLSNLCKRRGEECSRCDWTGDPHYLFKRIFYLSGKDLGVASDSPEQPSKCVLCEIIRRLLLVTARCEVKALTECATVDSVSGYNSEMVVDLDGFKTSVDIFTSSDTPRSAINDLFGIPRRHISQDNQLSPVSSEWAQRRIAKCVHSHQSCQSQGDSSFLPTRLISLQQDGGGLGLRLEHQDSVPPGSRYIALSYCWGNYRPICMTTAETLEQNMKSIPWDTLPRTFQDAVKFSLSLGIEYLWIDSICIIQGDQEDWRREAGKMYAIYKNSYVTFAALFGPNPTSGLRNTSMRRTSRPLAQLLIDQDTYTLYTRRIHYLGLQSVPGINFDGEMRLRYPLLSRAWTYQERIISPRVMLFTEDELVYQCLSDTGCECGATVEGDREFMTTMSKTDIFVKTRKSSASDIQDDQAPKGNQPVELNQFHQVTRSSFRFIKDAFTQAGRMGKKVCGRRMARTGVIRSTRVDAQHDNGQGKVVIILGHIISRDKRGVSGPNFHSLEVARTWRDKVVSEYSRLRVTKQTDRLPALAAMAEQFQRVREGENYLAGLWSGSLLWDLLWYAAPGLDRTGESQTGQGGEKLQRSAVLPTWSWACIQHRSVVYGRSSATDSIFPDATIMEAWCKYAEDNAFGVLESSKLVLHGRILHCRLEWGPLPKPFDAKCGWESIVQNGDSWAKFRFHHIFMDDVDADGSPHTAFRQEVYLLHVLSRYDPQPENLSWRFLVLSPDCQEERIYTRAGYFEWRQYFQPRHGNEVSNTGEALPPDLFLRLFKEQSILATCEIR